MSGRVDWSDIQVFLALLEARSFKEAAGRLAMNSSTVGRRLDSLESQLGVRLFERSRTGITPTAAAGHLTAAARHFERASAAFAQATGSLEREPVGTVTISAPTGIANLILVPLLGELRRRHPRLDVVVDTRQAFVDLDRHEADLALRGVVAGSVLPGGQTLIARRLLTGPVVPVASAAYAEALGEVVDLAAARWVTFAPPLDGVSWARKVLDHVPASSIVLRSNEPSTVIAAVRAGLGATWMTRVFCRDWLVEVPLGPGLSHLLETQEELWLVGHRALRDVPRVAAVWDYLTASWAA